MTLSLIIMPPNFGFNYINFDFNLNSIQTYLHAHFEISDVIDCNNKMIELIEKTEGKNW